MMDVHAVGYAAREDRGLAEDTKGRRGMIPNTDELRQQFVGKHVSPRTRKTTGSGQEAG
jgi:hypothetical protein